MTARAPTPGDPAPWFTQRSTTPSGHYAFDMTGGRYSVLYFFPSSALPATTARLDAISRDPVFDGTQRLFFGITADPADGDTRALPSGPGTRFILDADRAVARQYGVAPGEGRWFLVDPMVRVCAVQPDTDAGMAHILALVRHLPDPAARQSLRPTPALVLPNVLEPGLCEMLIRYFHTQPNTRSPVFTQAAQGSSFAVTDTSFKRRHDCTLRDPELVAQLQVRIIHRVVPEIEKYFQFRATRMERMIVACYDAAEHGCFGPHRDNTLSATAHRRFAVSINLNDDFDGGDLAFPEIGPHGFRPPAGGAIVFSCSVLHAVAPVTRGRRYACLPFLYDGASQTQTDTNRGRHSNTVRNQQQ
ncbi:hypothetical protein AA103196_0299 [Ameyamaea chiangmaiensis NBRC 103196]|uniref:2OG-Fe(II) oxygenase n=1 Tax=Ameyamaea chiangmaiensis TaxID=442969 RepID=A0A850PEN9_9PROT|nr:2OG-Fe(II) oxygenase [Ameyamaea chiangmaiensis]MBS4074695.1 2OG-Fe(II) oxygenase [Ameyamaea chiangmaiensis]NVN40402.1 2OG-Fe(II) oxygenase [Ameyamaea chiangmaiensis]GBQ62391.1 hypothetical protein AA103196_0299 [Ameyamaea chiangmaiensis NBRC 103196]